MAAQDATPPDINWLMLGLNLLGALAVFMFGMKTLSKNLQEALGPSLSGAIEVACAARWRAVTTGTFATAALSSATATSILVVDLLQAQFMSLSDSLGFCLGICVGSTLTPHLVAFKLTQYALPLAGIGRFLVPQVWRTPTGSKAGAALMGMGVMFLGMGHMSSCIGPLKTHPPFLNFITSLSNPAAGMVVAAVATMVLNSSSAMLGIAIALAQQGLLPLEVGMAFVLGSNIGTTAAPFFAALPAAREGDVDPLRFSSAYLLMKLATSLALLPLLGFLTPLVRDLVATPDGEVPVGAAVAMAHTLYNIVLALVFFPLLGQVASVVRALVPKAGSKGD